MSETTAEPSQQNIPSASEAYTIKHTNIYHLSMVLFISVIVSTFSFALFPLLSSRVLFRTQSFQNILSMIRSYGYYTNEGPVIRLVSRIARTNRLSWLGVVFRQTAFLGVGIWGIVSLKQGKKQAAIALYALAGLALVFIFSYVFNIAEMLRLPQVRERIGEYLGMFLRDYHTVFFYIVIICSILCAIFWAKKLNSPSAPSEQARKDISGVGGWLVISIIRFLATSLNYLLLVIFAILSTAGVKGLTSFGEGMIFTYFHWDFSLLTLFVSIYSLITFIALVGRKKSFPKMAVSLETFLLIFLSLLNVYFISYAVQLKDVSQFITPIITNLLAMAWSVVFIFYYMKSDRVKNTFVK